MIINIQMFKFAKENELYVSYFSVNFSSYFTLVLFILCVKLKLHYKLFCSHRIIFMNQLYPVSTLHNTLTYPVDTRRRFNVYKTPIRGRRRRIDVL